MMQRVAWDTSVKLTNHTLTDLIVHNKWKIAGLTTAESS